MAEYTETGEFKLEADLNQFEQELKDGQSSFKSFVDLVSLGAKEIVKEGNAISRAFRGLGERIAAPFKRMSDSAKKFAVITTGTMAFAAESAQKYHMQVKVLQQVVEHSNHAMEKQAKRLESIGMSSSHATQGIVDFNDILDEAKDVGKRFEISQKDVMIGMSNLAGVLPNTNKEWERMIALAKFAQQHHPNYGDMTTQMMNLTNAIATGNTRMIRHIAGNVSLSTVYEDQARKLGKSVGALTQMEKASATLVALEEQVGDVTGFATARLDQQVSIVNSLGRIWLSLGRIIFPFWNALKKIIAAVLAPIAEALEDVADSVDNMREETEEAGPVMKHIGEALKIFAQAIGWVYKSIVVLIVKLVALPFRAVATGFSIMGLAAGTAAAVIVGFFTLLGKFVAIGAIIQLIKLLKDFTFAMTGVTKASGTFAGAFKSMGKAMAFGGGEATKALSVWARLKNGVTAFGVAAKETKAGIKVLSLLKTAVPREGFTAVEAGLEGVVKAAGGVGRGAAGGAVTTGRAAAGGLGLGEGAKGAEAAKNIMTTLRGLGRGASTVIDVVMSKIVRTQKAIVNLLQPMTKVGEAGGLVSRVMTRLYKVLTLIPRMLISASRSSMLFFQGLMRVHGASTLFVQVAGKAGRAGELLARVFTGITAAGAKIGRLAAVASLFAKLAKLMPALALGMKALATGILGAILLYAELFIWLVKTYNAYKKWQDAADEAHARAAKSSRRTASQMRDHMQGIVGDSKNMGEAIKNAFSDQGTEGIQQLLAQLREQRKAIIDTKDLTAGGAIGVGSVFNDEDMKKSLARTKQLEIVLAKLNATTGKNRFASKAVLEMDRKVQAQAKGMFQEMKRLTEEQAKLGVEGIGTEEWLLIEERIKVMADSLGLSNSEMKMMNTETKFLEGTIAQIWKFKGPEFLKDFDSQIKQAQNAVQGLRETIISAKESTEQFVLAFQMGGTGMGGAGKAAANLDLLMQQFERAKNLDVRPEKLAEQARGILEGMGELSSARMEEFMMTPQGRAFNMQVSAMQKANPAAAAQMTRDLRAEIEKATRAEFGGEALLKEFQVLEEQALTDEHEQLEQAKTLLKDIEQAAFLFYKAIERSGGAAEEIKKQLGEFPSLLETINRQADIFAGLTGKARSDMEGTIEALKGAQGVRMLTQDPGAMAAAFSEAGVTGEGLDIETQIANLEEERTRLLEKYSEPVKWYQLANVELASGEKLKTKPEPLIEEAGRLGIRASDLESDFVKAVNALTAEIEKLRKANPNVPVETHASGGRIGGVPGIDKNVALLSRDEVVIRPEVSKPWMQQLLAFNATGDPAVFFSGSRGFKRGGRVGGIGYQFGGAVTDNTIDRLLSANNEVLNMISDKLDGLTDISETLSSMLEALAVTGRAVTVNVQIPDSKISFDPLPVHLMIDDVGRLATKQDLEELQPRPRTEGFGNF